MQKLADLHIHTTASDGAKTPSEIVRIAYDINLAAIAITDHDTIDGVEEGLNCGSKLGIEVVPGVEISTTYGSCDVHILGYFIDIQNKELRQKLACYKESRRKRAKKMVEKLDAAGIPITFDMVLEKAGDAAIGRPHISQVLCDLGIAGCVGSGFGKYLNEGCIGFVPKEVVTPHEAVKMINAAGGIAAIAHPAKIKCDEIIPQLVNCGLAAMEIYHPDHSKTAEKYYKNLAKRYGLIPTGGSDAHYLSGTHSTYVGERCIDYSSVEKMKFLRRNA